MKKKLIPLYRLEYQNDYGSSNKERIIVENGGFDVLFEGQPLCLSNLNHHKYFSKRKKAIFNKTIDLPGTVFSQKIVFFPEWVVELLKTVSINQKNAMNKQLTINDCSQYMDKHLLSKSELMGFKSRRPQIVDDTQDGLALDIRTPWLKLLAKTCCYGIVKKCTNKESYNEIFGENVIEENAPDWIEPNMDCSDEEFTKIFASCTIGPHFQSESDSEKQSVNSHSHIKDEREVLFEVLDKFGVKYDRERIISTQTEMLSVAQERSKNENYSRV